MKNELIKRIKSTINPNKKISEILPIKEFGINLTKNRNADEIIDQIVEESLRKACKELRSKGIETVMSSANRDNLLREGEKVTEKEDVRGKEWFLNAPTYESAGRGHAWIMINFTSLSDDNKEALFSLEQTKNDEGVNIGERIVWFIDGESFYLFDGEQSEMKTDLDKKFDERSFALQYNSDRYPKKL